MAFKVSKKDCLFWKCNICQATIKDRKGNFGRHLQKQHDITDATQIATLTKTCRVDKTVARILELDHHTSRDDTVANQLNVSAAKSTDFGILKVSTQPQGVPISAEKCLSYDHPSSALQGQISGEAEPYVHPGIDRDSAEIPRESDNVKELAEIPQWSLRQDQGDTVILPVWGASILPPNLFHENLHDLGFSSGSILDWATNTTNENAFNDFEILSQRENIQADLSRDRIFTESSCRSLIFDQNSTLQSALVLEHGYLTPPNQQYTFENPPSVLGSFPATYTQESRLLNGMIIGGHPDIDANPGDEAVWDFSTLHHEPGLVSEDVVQTAEVEQCEQLFDFSRQHGNFDAHIESFT